MTPSTSPQPEERDGTETTIEWGVRWTDDYGYTHTQNQRYLGAALDLVADEPERSVLVQRQVGPWSEVPS